MIPLDRYWQDNNWIAFGLIPLSWLFCLLVGLRRLFYRLGLARTTDISKPVIIVGNITAGGTGKTPLVIWLAHHLQKKGFRPGIVTRGYGGSAIQWPQQVRPDSDSRTVGDEAVLLARRSDCPVCADPNRVRAAVSLIKHTDCDLILSDDGLQHYALGRDIEIAVVDGERRFGNRLCHPAGPLRERLERLDEVDAIIAHGGEAQEGEFLMTLEVSGVVNLVDSNRVKTLAEFTKERAVHAVAGIGYPERFFQMLENAGIKVIRHPFPDHYAYCKADLPSYDGLALLMTEKDAVKCARFAQNHHWYVEVDADIDKEFNYCLETLIVGIEKDG